MRVLVCGGRDFTNLDLVRKTIDSFGKDVIVIHGGAQGADSLAGAVAKELGLQLEVYPAQWAKYGKAAGPIRNQQMLDSKPDTVIAFPGGKGTKDMVTRATNNGVPVIVVKESDDVD